ncbi:MAG: choice-of-anchor Q domain-containing protein [Kiritimatiellia bacterium]
MKRIILLAALSAGLVLSAGLRPAHGTDFYVSSVHASRNDSNPGTSPNAPWATFGKIKSAWGTTIKAGDTVHLGRGSTWTWSANVYWHLSQGGNATAGPITIRGDDYGTGALPILKKTGTGGGDNGGICFNISGASYVTLRDFVMDNGSDSGFVATGIMIGGYGQTANISNVNVLNMTIRKIGNLSTFYSSGIHVSANNSRTISNCLIENNDLSEYSGHGLNVYPQKGSTPSANYHINNTYRNNRIHSPSPKYWPGCQSGIHISFGGSGNIYEYNYVEGGGILGCIFLMNCANNETGLIVRYNVLKNSPASSGILFGSDSAGPRGTVVNGDFYGNLIVGCNRSGISFEAMNWYGGNVKIYNNTLYNNGQFVSSFGGEVLVWDQNTVNIDFANNILAHLPKSGSSTTCLYLRQGYAGAFTHRNNVYWHTSGGGAVAVYDKGTTYTVSNVKNYEASAQNADPLFTDLSQVPLAVSSTAGTDRNGYLPKAASLAINKGDSLGTIFANSLNLAARPQGTAWDIGAYEYSTGTPTPAMPAVPSALTASAVSFNQIRLAWQDNSADETGFKIERGTNATSFSQIATVASNVIVFVNTGLTANIAYYYRIRAYNAVGDSDYSGVASLTPGEIIFDNSAAGFSVVSGQDPWLLYANPAGQHYGGSHHYNNQAGTGLDVARWTFPVASNGTYDVYAWWWESATRPSNVPYTVYYSGGSNTVRVDQRAGGGQWNLLGRFPFISTGTVSVSDAVLSGTDVVADAIRLVFRSATVPAGVPPPAAPSVLTASANVANQISLFWQDNATNETGFKIERSLDALGFAQIATVGGNITSYVNAGLADNVAYYYRVRSYNAAADSAYANVSSAKTLAALMPPAAPSNLTAVATASNQITVAWQDKSGDETGFKVESGTDGSAYSQIALTGPNVTSTVHIGRAVGVTNYYRVRASNASGNSAYSAVASAVIGEIIVDDADPGFNAVGVMDAWGVYQGADGQHYRGAHRYNHEAGTGTDTATWTFFVPFTGMYDVYVWWWDGSWRAPDVPYVVNYYGGAMTVKMDQRTNGGKWNLLGTFPLGGTNSVMVSDAVSSGGDVVADAVRLVWRTDLSLTVPMPPTGLRVLP